MPPSTKAAQLQAREIPRKGKKQGATKSRKELITSLLSKIEGQLDSEKTKVTLTDFIRLIQLQRELEQEEQPAEVIVTWKDLSERPSTEK
jgi:DNA polymerase III sliding clamp (beta) subunit (PCNA family)